jgi:hypothetical protein
MEVRGPADDPALTSKTIHHVSHRDAFANVGGGVEVAARVKSLAAFGNDLLAKGMSAVTTRSPGAISFTIRRSATFIPDDGTKTVSVK